MITYVAYVATQVSPMSRLKTLPGAPHRGSELSWLLYPIGGKRATGLVKVIVPSKSAAKLTHRS